MQTLPLDKDLGSDLSNKSLNERLASVLVDCQEKDDLIVKHAKAAEQAIAGEALSEKFDLVLDIKRPALMSVFLFRFQEGRSKGNPTKAGIGRCIESS